MKLNILQPLCGYSAEQLQAFLRVLMCRSIAPTLAQLNIMFFNWKQGYYPRGQSQKLRLFRARDFFNVCLLEVIYCTYFVV